MSQFPAQHTEEPAIQEFIDWIDKNRVKGTLGSSDDVDSPFMPTTLLKDHLKASRRLHRILTALFPQYERGGWSHLPVTEEQVWQSGIVKILSIFILIGRGTYLKYIVKYPVFKDESLPYLSEPAHFPQLAHGDKSIWEAFYEMQFQFCPYEFKPRETGRNLERATILPIIKKEEIDRGGSAAIYKIKLHAEYDQFQSHTGTVQGQAIASNRPSNTYILKSYYDNKDACIYHENEVKGFQLLGLKQDTQQCLVRFYGSFIYQGTYHVLLEYADRGTLEDYFHNVQPPYRAEDIIVFWKSLFQIIKALSRIHELKPSGGAKDLDVMQGWHQDVDPTNILVFSGQSSSPYDVEFKLSDLGLSHFQRFTDRNDTARDAWGTRTYGAPECYRWDDFLERCDIQTKPYVDIWSYGCVCSEAAMWIVRGGDGVDEYRSRRKEETDNLEDFRDGFAFHDTETVLRSVNDTHDEVRGYVRRTDKITVPVLDQIIADALEPNPEARPKALALYRTSERLLRSASRQITSAQARVIARKDVHNQQYLPHDQSNAVAPTATTLAPRPASLETLKSSLFSSIFSGAETSYSSHSSEHTSHSVIDDNVPRSLSSRYKLDETGSPLRQSTPPTPLAVAKAGAFMERSRDSRASSKVSSSVSQPIPQQRDRPSNQFRQQRSDRRIPTLSLEVGVKYIVNHKRATRLFRKDAPKLPQEVFLSPLDERSIVFVIDNSETMLRYREDVKELLNVLAWLIKKRDQEGYELFFTNASSKSSQNYREATPAVKAVSNVTFSGMADMDSTLDTVLKKYDLKRRNLCIYVFTDGHWQPGSTAIRPIRNLVSTMNRLSVPRTRAGIQFIQFGNDLNGTTLLQDLDSKLGKIIKTEMEEANPDVDIQSMVWNVVDTTRFPDGDVLKMLLGAISPFFGDDESDSENVDDNLQGRALNVPRQSLITDGVDEEVRDGASLYTKFDPPGAFGDEFNIQGGYEGGHGNDGDRHGSGTRKRSPLDLSYVDYHGVERGSTWQRLSEVPISTQELSGVGILEISPFLHYTWLVLAWEVPILLSTSGDRTGSLPKRSTIFSYEIDVGNVLVLSGKHDVYEASIAREHLRKHWGSVGIDVLDIINDALTHMGELRNCPAIDSQCSICAFDSRLVLNFGESMNDQHLQGVVINAMQWFCQALRPYREAEKHGLAVSRSHQHLTNDILAFELEPLSDWRPEQEGSSTCWTNLFVNAVVAEQEIPRIWGQGLEITFDLMIQLSGVDTYIWLEDERENDNTVPIGGYIALGFFTALFPVKRHPVEGVQWHLIISDDDPLSLVDLSRKQSTRIPIPIKHISEVSGQKCFLGWCEDANILLGTAELQNALSWSGLPQRSKSLHASGWNVTAQLGGTIGPMQAIGQVTRAWQLDNVRQRFEPNATYAKALQVSSRQIALVFDTGTKRAWLVPKLSLMLHLCHTYVQHFKDPGRAYLDPVPFAEPTNDGGLAAKQALSGQGDVVVFEHGTDQQDQIRLRNVLVDISTNMSKSLAVGEKPRFLRALGPELMDMIVEPGAGALLTEVSKACFPSSSSAAFAQLVDSVYVCSNLGTAIRPAALPAQVACDCMTLEHDQGHLAVHLRCLEALLQRRNHSLQHLQHSAIPIGDGGRWCLQSYVPCSHSGTVSFWAEPRKVLQSISRANSRSIGPRSNAIPAVTGAVVFGGAGSIWDRILDILRSP